MPGDDRRPPVVALLGVGIMGRGMGRSILRAGLPLRVWNRTQGKAEALEPDGAFVAATPSEAVRGADVIVTMLADGDTVADVMTEAAPGLTAGQVWAQTSTAGVVAVRQLTELADQHGLVFVDSPVLGTRNPAEQGTLIVLAAGPDGARERVQPVFDAIGSRTLWLGEPGTASRLKLVANTWVLALTTGVAETLALAQGLGIEPEKFLEAVSGGPLDCPYLQLKASAILGKDFTPSFTVSMASKDARLIVAASRASGVRMPVAEAMQGKFARAAELGHAGEDMAAAYFASFGRGGDGG
ncbi:MAG TPA: NAD(P)-dependent oxidoreductase [Streptosporangiaceae bacterium]|nr:NAD(P)-dependent oxidoreductase [Streptosporangiaceae bacterium]